MAILKNILRNGNSWKVKLKSIILEGVICKYLNLEKLKLDDYLGSACLEIDSSAYVISYEEYHSKPEVKPLLMHL